MVHSGFIFFLLFLRVQNKTTMEPTSFQVNAMKRSNNATNSLNFTGRIILSMLFLKNSILIVKSLLIKPDE